MFVFCRRYNAANPNTLLTMIQGQAFSINLTIPQCVSYFANYNNKYILYMFDPGSISCTMTGYIIHKNNATFRNSSAMS
jgi:hypothetical protein